MDASEVYSLLAFEEAMASESTSRSLSIEVAAETPWEISAKVIEILRKLGFERYSIGGPGFLNWFLYPPPNVDLDGYDQADGWSRQV